MHLYRLRIFQNTVLRTAFYRTRNNITYNTRRKLNNTLHLILLRRKSKRIRQEEYVRSSCKMSVGKFKGKDHFGDLDVHGRII
jgi:hypothetical protein